MKELLKSIYWTATAFIMLCFGFAVLPALYSFIDGKILNFVPPQGIFANIRESVGLWLLSMIPLTFLSWLLTSVVWLLFSKSLLPLLSIGKPAGVVK
jgi:hypothetical protein